jgi:hypothetical protein
LVYGGLLTTLVSGCAGVPPLQEAELAEVALATPEDLSRFKAAQNSYYRAAYPRGLPEITVLQPAWPTVRIAFRSSQQLFNPREAGIRHAVVYPCGDQDRAWDSGGLGSEPILWRNRFVDKAQSERIAGQLATEPGPQEYEVFIRYDNWDRSEVRAPGDPITLIPMQEDLCLSLQKLNYPFAPGIGEPLRVGKNLINRAVGELPISLPFPELPIRPVPPS